MVEGARHGSRDSRKAKTMLAAMEAGGVRTFLTAAVAKAKRVIEVERHHRLVLVRQGLASALDRNVYIARGYFLETIALLVGGSTFFALGQEGG